MKQIFQNERHAKHVLVIVLVVAACIAEFLIVASPYNKHGQRTITYAATDCTPNSILVNPCHPWIGAAVEGYPQTGSDAKSQFLYAEQRLGRQMDIFHDYHSPTASLPLNSTEIYFANRANTYIYVNWKPASDWASAGGSDSTVNAKIDQAAASIKSIAPHKIFLTIWHEPENDVSGGTSCPTKSGASAGTPAQYRAMWANVENRFNADGVTNVVWTMNYMGYPAWDCLVPEVWPGNSLVDWVTFDSYSSSDSSTVANTIGHVYGLLESDNSSSTDFESKPWGLGEWGDCNTADQAHVYAYDDAMKAALDAGTYPRLKMYMAYDDNGNNAGMGCLTEYSKAGVLDPIEQSHYNSFANDPIFTASATSTPPPSGGGAGTPPPSSGSGSGATKKSTGGKTTTSTATAAPPTVGSFTAAPATVTIGQSVVLSWQTTNATNCSINPGGPQHTATSSWTTLAYDAAGSYTYTLVCQNSAGATASKSVTVGVNPATKPPTNVMLSASSTAIKRGGTVLLSWSSLDATSCTLEPGNFAARGGSSAKLITNLSATRTYKAVCLNGAGSTESNSVTINVIATAPKPVPPVIISLTASPANVLANGISTISWQTNDVASDGCILAPSPMRRANGNASWTTPALKSSQVYVLACKNGASSAVATKTVSVMVAGSPLPAPPALPSVTLSLLNSKATITATTGQSVVNAQATSSVTAGSLLTLDPAIVTDATEVKAVSKVEYYNDNSLLQTANKPPFTLNTQSMKAGVYNLTQRAYFRDGSMAQQSQLVTIEAKKTAILKPGTNNNLLWVSLSGAVVVVAVYVIFLRWRLSRSVSGADMPTATITAQTDNDQLQNVLITRENADPRKTKFPWK